MRVDHSGHRNPNNCSIRATHFIAHTSTDYSLVNQYWHKGHEIAAHSITHRNNLTYWETMSPEEWKTEMVGVRKMIGQFANLDPCEVKGNRAPFLQGGGDNMFNMLMNNNFLYDCSWPTRAYGYIDAEYGLYPYTLDYSSKQGDIARLYRVRETLQGGHLSLCHKEPTKGKKCS